MPRKRLWGVDFNRDVPGINEAIQMYDIFNNNKDQKAMYEYRKRYAWVAKDEEDYKKRLSIYQDFWGEVGRSSKIIFVHRAFPKIKAVSSIMDIVVLSGEHTRRKIQEKVNSINSEKYQFFKSIEKSYKNMVYFEAERTVANIFKTFGKFEMDSLQTEFKSNMLKDINILRNYSSDDVYNKFLANFTPQNYLECVKSALENTPTPQITVEKVFNGELAHGPRRSLQPIDGKFIIEVECSRFISFWYPSFAAEIINFISKD